MKDYERELMKHQTQMEAKEAIFNDLQRKFDEQTKQLKSAVDGLCFWNFSTISCFFLLLARTICAEFE